MKKMKIFGLIAMLSLCLLLTLAGCNNQAGDTQTPTGTTGADNGGVTTAPPVTEAPKPTYTAETQTFETFADLKENYKLFADQAPCTRSTKGYYSVGDGGAATYSIVNKKPTGSFERIADGLWAQIAITEELTKVNPQMFGAYGDGKTNDSTALTRAINFASENNLTLELLESNYYTKQITVFDNVNVQSNNAKISYYGLTQHAPAVNMGSNVNIYGTINIFAVDNKMGNHGGRAALAFGDYGSGVGVHNCYVEHVVCTGGFPGANAVFITGDSSNITIDRVTVPAGTSYWRAVLAHWGYTKDHWVVQDEKGNNVSYGHSENWLPTKHPHDIHLGVVELYGTKRFSGMTDYDNAGVTLSAVYNVTVDEIIVENAAHAFHMLPGDIAFEYADPEIKAIGQSNIYVKKITATKMRSTAINFTCYTHYLPGVTSTNEVKIDEVHVTAAMLNDSPAINVYGMTKVEIGTMTTVGFRMHAMTISRDVNNVTIDTWNVENCATSLINVIDNEDYDGSANIKIVNLNVKGTGRTSDPMFNLRRISDFEVTNLTIDNETNCNFILQVADDVNNIHIGTIKGKPNGLMAVVKATGTITEENAVSIGSTDFTATMTSGNCTLVTKQNQA